MRRIAISRLKDNEMCRVGRQNKCNSEKDTHVAPPIVLCLKFINASAGLSFVSL